MRNLKHFQIPNLDCSTSSAVVLSLSLCYKPIAKHELVLSECCPTSLSLKLCNVTSFSFNPFRELNCWCVSKVSSRKYSRPEHLFSVENTFYIGIRKGQLNCQVHCFATIYHRQKAWPSNLQEGLLSILCHWISFFCLKWPDHTAAKARTRQPTKRQILWHTIAK